MTPDSRRKCRYDLLLQVLVVLAALALPSTAFADSRVRLQARVEPTYPIAGEQVSLRVQVTDRSSRPLDTAQVVALVWMDPRQNPGMAMAEANSAGNALRLVGRPQQASGEYLFNVLVPMSGRWRAQVWVSSSGATGTIPLSFDVVEEAPPADTNWLLVAVAWALVGVATFAVWRRALVPPNRSKLPNLLEIAPFRVFLRSRWYPALLQWPTLAAFVLVTYLLLAGSYEAHDNLGSALTWIVWWPLLPLIFLLFGRLWCAVCPMSLMSDLSQRLLGRRRQVPSSLKRRGPWLVLGAFLAITWADLILGLVEVPSYTAVLLLAVTAGVVCCGLIFARRAWCRYLCPIGGLSGNYAMAAALELRADGKVCRTCRGFECVRGDKRTAGCPMFEFPRTMSSNHHCNLCGNCLKTCPNDALRVSARPPADELGFDRRGRWEEAILAATLVGVVTMQTIVMLDSSFPALAVWLGSGHGAGNPLALTGLFIMLTALPLIALGLTSLLSAGVARESHSVNMLRFAYVLIPLGLASHLAHNLNHLMSEGRSVLNAGLRLVEQPVYAAPVLESPSTVKLLQYSLIVGGALTSLAVTWRLANGGHRCATTSGDQSPIRRKGDAPQRRFLAAIPYYGLVTVLTAALLLLFAQDMTPRLQLTAEAHDQVTTGQIAAAKGSVATFLGRATPLEYVHLEEHGYRDIILRGGDNYYFVDIQNMLVTSMFSSRFRAVTPTPIAKATARQVALDFALQHYPNFSQHNLQPAIGPEKTSPYTGGYVFEWRQYVDGVTGPNYAEVTTDGFGAVAIYSARDIALTAPTQPLVQREQAVAVSQREVDIASCEVRTTLDIGPEITGRQILRWTVELVGIERSVSPPRAEVVVDAITGEILSVLKWS